MKPRPRFGPGFLVTAAFIGPGTITTASIAGARFGYSLLWALVFSILATIVLQEMAARLGIVARIGLGDAIRTSTNAGPLRFAAAALIVTAIGFGNAAFQTGNVTGAALGLELLTGCPLSVGSLLVAAAAAAILFRGRYAWIERTLIALVLLMSAAFIGTAVLTRPVSAEMIRSIVRPALPDGSITTIIALIGTTVVPYNLFLHAGTVSRKWSTDTPLRQAIRESRLDTVAAVALGGLASLAVIVAAAQCFPPGTRIAGAADMTQQLEPLLGPAAKWVFAAGLLAAGLTSAVTAPLAAAYATAGALGWKSDLQSPRFRAVWAVVLLAGTGFAVVGTTPLRSIVVAQAANAFVLPVVAVFLILAVNKRAIVKDHRNGPLANLLGIAVVLVVTGLGAFKLLQVFQLVK